MQDIESLGIRIHKTILKKMIDLKISIKDLGKLTNKSRWAVSRNLLCMKEGVSNLQTIELYAKVLGIEIFIENKEDLKHEQIKD